MGKLRQITQQLEDRKAAAIADAEEAKFVTEMASQIADNLHEAVTSTMKAVDLKPIISAIASEVPETDLGPVQKAISDAYSGLRSTMMAECNRVVKSIPKPQEMPKTDLSPVLGDLQWLKSFLALKQDPKMPDHPLIKGLDVKRNDAGFISYIKVEY
jgi:hypothetical protein